MLRARWHMLGVLVASILIGGAARAQQPRVTVRIAASAKTSPKAQGRLRLAIERAVTSGGLELAPNKLPDRLVRCELPKCAGAIAAATSATHVLDVDAKLEEESFKISVALWDAGTARMLGTDGRDCLICDEQDFVEAAAERTRALLARSFAAPTPVERAPTAVAPPAVSPDASTVLVQPAISPTRDATESGTWNVPALVGGTGLVIAGLVSVVHGVGLLGVNGDPVCGPSEAAPCDSRYNTRTPGSLFLAAGAVAVIGGGALAWWARPTSPLSRVSLGPTGVAFTGKF